MDLNQELEYASILQTHRDAMAELATAINNANDAILEIRTAVEVLAGATGNTELIELAVRIHRLTVMFGQGSCEGHDNPESH